MANKEVGRSNVQARDEVPNGKELETPEGERKMQNSKYERQINHSFHKGWTRRGSMRT